MAKQTEQPLHLGESELDAVARIAKPRLHKHTANIAGFYRARTLIAGGHDFAGVRDYAPGDEVRRVNWRASARSRQFQVHQQQQERGSRWFICLDTSNSMYFPSQQKLYLCRQLGAAFAYLLISAGNQVGLMTFNEKVDHFYPLGHGRKQYATIYRALQSSSSKGCNSLLHACFPYLRQESEVIVLSDFLQADFMQSAMEQFIRAGHQIHALQVLADNEAALPNGDYVTLTDSETGEFMTIDASETNASRAEHALQEHCHALRNFCHEQRIRYTSAHSDQRWKTILVSHLSTL